MHARQTHVQPGVLLQVLSPDGLRRVLPACRPADLAAHPPSCLPRLSVGRAGARLFFAWLRGLARLCTYVSSLLSVISGALSFTVRKHVLYMFIFMYSCHCTGCGLCLGAVPSGCQRRVARP